MQGRDGDAERELYNVLGESLYTGITDAAESRERFRGGMVM